MVGGTALSVPGAGTDLQLKGWIFLTLMAILTKHFLWLACGSRWAVGLLVQRLSILLNCLASVCEDSRLDEPMGYG